MWSSYPIKSLSLGHGQAGAMPGPGGNISSPLHVYLQRHSFISLFTQGGNTAFPFPLGEGQVHETWFSIRYPWSGLNETGKVKLSPVVPVVFYPEQKPPDLSWYPAQRTESCTLGPCPWGATGAKSEKENLGLVKKKKLRTYFQGSGHDFCFSW